MSPSRPDQNAQRLTPSQCCAIIVTWQPQISDLVALLESLSAQGCASIVIDNGSANAEALTQALHPMRDDVTLLSWSENRGLAAGMNAGILQARAQGYRFVFLFDQDSCIGGRFCQSMLAAWGQAVKLGHPVAAIGPRLQDPQSGRKTPFKCFRLLARNDIPAAPGLFATDFLISSGTLLPLSELSRIGLMKESYFIDNIDLEWCFRARSLGYALFGTDRTVLFHRIGEDSQNPLVAAGIMVSHSPLRSYYSTRNRLHLRRQSYAPRDWKVRDLIRFAIKTSWLLIFNRRRREYLQQIRRGIKDAGDLRD